MEVGYRQAMEQLEAMFDKFDRETIQAVLATNEGHMERTIDDLMKLAEEVENAPDDDDLFADTDSRPNTYSYQGSTTAKSIQESEDAKMAYELQMREIQAEQNQNVAGYRNGSQQNTANMPSSYGNNPSGLSSDQKKKASFYKKVKVGLNNLFKRKGKAGRKGPTRNPGLYAEIDANEGNNLVEDDDNEAPMQLSDVLGGGNKAYEDNSPATPPNRRRSHVREHNDNRNFNFGESNYDV